MLHSNCVVRMLYRSVHCRKIGFPSKQNGRTVKHRSRKRSFCFVGILLID